MLTFTEQRARFKAFYDIIAATHLRSKKQNRGHGLDHDVTVAQIALTIADPESADAVWVAGLLHSFDHLFEPESDIESEMKRALLGMNEKCLAPHSFKEVTQAAIRHAEKNQDDQGIVQVILMDADRLANMQAAVLIRAGQFHSTLPALEFKYLNGTMNPDSTYPKPKSVLDAQRLILSEYLPQFRVPKAKEMAGRYARRIQSYIEEIEKDYAELSLSGIIL